MPLANILSPFFLSVAIAATSQSPLSNIICYSTGGISQWTYVQPRLPSKGKAASHQALISIELEPGRTSQGTFTQSIIVKAINGLYWDDDFQKVYYKAPGRNPVLCAHRQWYGLEKNETDCQLKGEINAIEKTAPEICGQEKSFLFKGALFVEN